MFKRRAVVLWHLDSEEAKTNPVARVVRHVFLEKALEAGARAIVFGVPAGVAWDWEEEARVHEEEGAAFEASAEEKKFREMLSKRFPPVREPVEETDVRKCYGMLVDGTTMGVPVWLDMEGRFEGFRMIPAPIYLQVLWMAEMLRVGIDYAGEQALSPRRYIELEGRRAGTRRFVEVQLNWGRDNTMRVEVMGVREETREVQAVRLVEC